MDSLFIPYGTLVNTATVIAGSVIGLMVRSRLSDRYKKIIFQVIGLCTIIIGIDMCMGYPNMIHVIGASLFGALLGEWMKIEDWLKKMSESIKKKIKNDDKLFTEGLITAFILFCVGPVTIIGTLQEGLSGDRELILTKSLLDGTSSIFLASVYGIGILVSAAPLLITQSILTYTGFILKEGLPELMIDLIGATGGVMVMGLGINLLEIKHIKVANFLPSIIFAVLIYYMI